MNQLSCWHYSRCWKEYDWTSRRSHRLRWSYGKDITPWGRLVTFLIMTVRVCLMYTKKREYRWRHRCVSQVWSVTLRKKHVRIDIKTARIRVMYVNLYMWICLTIWIGITTKDAELSSKEKYIDELEESYNKKRTEVKAWMDSLETSTSLLSFEFN